MKPYYFPIKSECLAHYFGCACIKPSKYFTNKPEDLQNSFENFLLFSTSKGCIECNCCMEIVLTPEEEETLIPAGGTWYLFETSLPITRVKKIYFTEDLQKNTTLTNIKMGTAFIPDSIIGKSCNFETISVKDAKAPEDCYIKDQTEQIELFDRIMGALVIMRLARESYMNFSESYIDTLAVFNKSIATAIVSAGKPINCYYSGLFTDNPNYKSILPHLNQQININDVQQMAKEESQSVVQNKFTRKIELDKLEKKTYILAVLTTYGVGIESRREKIDGLILSHFKGIKYAQFVAMCYGYSRGYNMFNSYYRVSENNKVDVKFKLDSQLDYYTIESVFQYAFNNKKVSDRFDYLDSWCNKKSIPNVIKKKDFLVLDTVVIGKKKARVGSKDWWNSFAQFCQKIDLSVLLSEPLSNIFKSLAEQVIQECTEEKEEEIAEIKSKYEEKNNTLSEEIQSVKKSLSEKTKEVIEVTSQLEEKNKRLTAELQQAKAALDKKEEEIAKIKEQFIEIENRLAEGVQQPIEGDKKELDKQTQEITEVSPEKEQEEKATDTDIVVNNAPDGEENKSDITLFD